MQVLFDEHQCEPKEGDKSGAVTNTP
jgi:hypothetical protein